MAALTPNLQMDIPRILSGLPETSPFKRVLLEAMKGAFLDPQSFPLLPSDYIPYFCCILPAYRRQQIHCKANCALKLNG